MTISFAGLLVNSALALSNPGAVPVSEVSLSILKEGRSNLTGKNLSLSVRIIKRASFADPKGGTVQNFSVQDRSGVSGAFNVALAPSERNKSVFECDAGKAMSVSGVFQSEGTPTDKYIGLFFVKDVNDLKCVYVTAEQSAEEVFAKKGAMALLDYFKENTPSQVDVLWTESALRSGKIGYPGGLSLAKYYSDQDQAQKSLLYRMVSMALFKVDSERCSVKKQISGRSFEARNWLDEATRGKTPKTVNPLDVKSATLAAVSFEKNRLRPVKDDYLCFDSMSYLGKGLQKIDQGDKSVSLVPLNSPKSNHLENAKVLVDSSQKIIGSFVSDEEWEIRRRKVRESLLKDL